MKSKHKKMIAPVIITIFVILYYIVYFGFIMSLIDGIWRVAFGIFPIIFSVIMVKVCIERIKEIKKGEDDDISKY